MSKTKTHFLCRSCGGVQSRWMGKCPDCGTWDALEKYVEPKVSAGAFDHAAESWRGDGVRDQHGEQIGAIPLPAIERSDVERLPTGISEFDRVLGGGVVPGSAILLGGDPGIGKSTLLLQAAGRMAASECPVLYVTSEESAYQTRLRAERLFADGDEPSGLNAAGMDALYVLADTNLARIVEQVRHVRPRVVVLDSIQMVYKADLEAAPGSVTQLRRCCMELVYLAKVSNIAVVLVGHVTKDGQLAGPKLLEHLVDAVLSFEGDRHHAHRVVRGIKNRFGTTLEVGLFEMTGSGLAEVKDLSRITGPHDSPRPGSAVCPAMHGSRSLLVEIQALTATGFLGSAKRKTSGLDGNRLAMLIAVLEKHGGLRLADQDVFASAVGGLKVVEPAADLAICLSIVGAHYNRALSAATAVIGEVGLGGELRPVHQIEQRLRECQRLGYGSVMLASSQNPVQDLNCEVVRIPTIAKAIEHLH